MAHRLRVWLSSNGNYWRAAWRFPDGTEDSRGLGSKQKVSRRQANARCRQIEAELRTGIIRAQSAPRVSEWLRTYRALRSDVSEDTRATYDECAVYLRIHFDDDPPIDEITRADAADWRAKLDSGELTNTLNQRARSDPACKNRAGRAWRTPKPATVARHTRAAKLMFQEAVKQDRITFNPFDRLKGAPPKVVKNWRQITRKDLDRILNVCPNPGWKNLFALCRLDALRLTEALELEWPSIDWHGNRITVNEGIEQETTKRRLRVTPIEPSKAPTGLTALLHESFEAAPAGSRLVCEGVAPNNLRRTALNLLKRSGVGIYPKPFHTLRKCRVSELALVYPQMVVEEWCGHDEAVSREHYQRVPDELFRPPRKRSKKLDADLAAEASPTSAQKDARAKRTQSRKPLSRRR